MRLATVLLAIGLSLGLSGCWFRKKKPLPPPPPPAVPQETTTPAIPEAKPLPMPMPLPQPAPQRTTPAIPGVTLQPLPPAPRSRRRRGNRPRRRRRRPLNRRNSRHCSLRRNSARSFPPASAASTKPSTLRVSRVPGRHCNRPRAESLSQTQRETVERIKTFVQQAEESKAKDLATAFELVRRADLLGQDLVKDLQVSK